MKISKYWIFNAILILLLSNINVFAQIYWIQQPSPTQKKLTKCQYLDSLYGWVIGDSGIILRTTNSGANWGVQQSGVTGSELRDLTFISRNTGWIISVDSTYKTFILKTTNSGVNWSKVYFPDTTIILNTIWFNDNLTGFVSGFNGKIFKTTNNCASWNECYIDTTGCLYLFPKNDIKFINSQTGFACGGVLDLQGIFLKTTNAGAVWYSSCISAEPMNEVKYIGNNRIALMGGDYDLGSIYGVSSNMGETWFYSQTSCYGNATAFAFRTPAEAWAVLSFSGLFAVNLDSMKSGSRWQCINTPGLTALYAIDFFSPANGYAFGENGSIYKYNENVIGLQNNNNSVPGEIFLYQNYPNPFNPETNIEYYLPEASNVVIRIFDINGKEVSSYNEGYKQKGKYSFLFSSVDLPSAVYYYVLNTEFGKLTKKMVLIK